MTKSKLIVPKHVWDGAQAEKDKNELEKIPNPVGWRMVLFPLKLKEKTKSGLQYLITEKGSGPKVTSSYQGIVDYAVYFEDGRLLETSKMETAKTLDLLDNARAAAGGYQPIPVNVSDTGQMIVGFKEGLRKLRQGDKATLFLPFDIAYGDRGSRGIPPKSNLIFEIEVVEVLKD